MHEFCRRVLGPGLLADDAAVRAREAEPGDRVRLLAAATRECRTRAAGHEPPAHPPAQPDAEPRSSLGDAVAQELASASAALPERQREVLALRELLRLPYAQIAQVMDIGPAAVGPLLARARLRLRVERRGGALPVTPSCAETERGLRLLARRQDAEALTSEDDEWLLAHLASCTGCEVAHAAMLEASVCYRAWPGERPRENVAAELEP